MVVEVLTPLTTMQFDAAWLELQSPKGSLVVKEQHAPLVCSLVRGSEIVIHLQSGKQEVIPITHGIAHVARDRILLLLYS